ncbi:MAG: autotransporter-associated beta strand repeat-containing protein [Thermoguttaceae bacterium]|nr:autotransporter-associated beta strand repeat-containing protein [Thermoguttaceae bacterium]
MNRFAERKIPSIYDFTRRNAAFLSAFVSLVTLIPTGVQADVVINGNTITGGGTYSQAINATGDLAVTPGSGETITFTNNVVTTGTFNQTGSFVVLEAGTKNSFGAFFITNNPNNASPHNNNTKMTLNGELTVNNFHVCKRGTAYVDINEGAILTVNNEFLINQAKNAQGRITQNGGTVNLNGTGNLLRLGHYPNTGYPSEYNLNAGTLNVPNTVLHVGWDGYAKLNISGGTANMKGINLSAANGKGFLNLTGGTLNLGDGGVTHILQKSATANAPEIKLGTATINAAASHTWAENLTLNLNSGATTTFNADEGKTITVDSLIQGSGAIQKTGAGTLALTGANTYTGLTTIAGGTLQVSTLNGTINSKVYAPGAETVLELGFNTESGDTANYGGSIEGQTNQKNLTIKKVGAGTQTLSRTGYLIGGSNSSLKEVIVDEGRLVVDAVHKVFTASNTKGFFDTAPITVNEGGTLEYVQIWTTSPNIDLTLNGGTLQLDNGQYLNKLNFNSGKVTLGSDDAPLRAGYVGSGVWNVTGGNSVIENPVEIVKNGDHTTFTLNIADGASLEMKRNLVGLSSYPGSAVNVNGTGTNGTGLLKLYSGSDLPKVADLGTVTFNNADVQINGGMETWSGGGFFGSNVVLTNADLNVNPDAGKTILLDNAISGNGTLTKTGDGTLHFSNRKTYSGGTTIREGKVIANAKNASASTFGTGRIVVEDGAVLEFQVSNQLGYGANAPNDILIRGTLKPSDYTHIKNVTLENGTIEAEYGFTNGGSGLDFATRTGVIASTGESVINSRININGGAKATFDVVSGNLTVNGIIKSDGKFTKTGDGTLSLTAANTYTGGTTVNAGTLKLTGAGTPGTGTVTLGDKGTLELNVADGAEKTFTNKVAGSGQVAKTGAGTLKLNTANGFETSSLNVLDGRANVVGTLSGDLAIADGASFSPGDGIGTLTVNGLFSADDGARLVFEIGEDSSDLLVIGSEGSLEISENAILEFLFTGEESGEAYTLIQAEDGFTELMNAEFWNDLLSKEIAANWHLGVVGNSLQLLAGASDAVPEPAAWVLLVLGAAGLYCVRRRNAK